MEKDLPKQKDVVKLISVDSDINAGIVLNLLEENQIPGYIKDRETGSYMSIYMGYSIFGKEIYVRREDLEKAKELTAFMEPDPKIADVEQTLPFYKNKRIVSRIVLLLFLVPVLIIFIQAVIRFFF